MFVETISQNFRKARSVNATNGSFPAMLCQTAEPKADAGTATGHAVIELSKDGVTAQNGVVVMPYSTGSNNDTYSVRVYGWRYVPGTASTLGVWRPFLLVEMACTASSTEVGVAGGVILDTEMFADTLSLTTGNDDVSVDIVSPTADVAAHWQGDLKGAQKLELTFKIGTTPTGLNALVALL